MGSGGCWGGVFVLPLQAQVLPWINRYTIDAVALHYVTKPTTLFSIPNSAFQGNAICNVLTLVLSVFA